jgi:Raf kinase inhibitor-like YbhB/YbcL family protein
MKISSPAFPYEGQIPPEYTCDGADINPPFDIEDIPEQAVSLAFVIDDPDAPMGNWNHWLIWNIDPRVDHIAENSVPANGVFGTNSSGEQVYHGPCPPMGSHRYFFKLYALDTMLDIPMGSERDDFLNAIEGHIIEEAEHMGRYSREEIE